MSETAPFQLLYQLGRVSDVAMINLKIITGENADPVRMHNFWSILGKFSALPDTTILMHFPLMQMINVAHGLQLHINSP